MDESRLNAASLGLKNCQQVLLRLLAGHPAGSLHADIATALGHLVDAQDGFIVLREALLAMEFDNAVMRERLQQARISAAPGVAPTEVRLR